jgi:hypothetical protein
MIISATSKDNGARRFTCPSDQTLITPHPPSCPAKNVDLSLKDSTVCIEIPPTPCLPNPASRCPFPSHSSPFTPSPRLAQVNCPFYFKIGACRHGERCARQHHKPPFSQTILVQHMYSNPASANVVAGAGGPGHKPPLPANYDERKVRRRCKRAGREGFGLPGSSCCCDV